MLVFNKLKLSDIPLIRPFFTCLRSRVSDCSVGGTFIWRDYMQTEYCISGGSLIFKVVYLDRGTAFTVPICGDVTAALAGIAEYCAVSSAKPLFCTVSAGDARTLSDFFSAVEVTPERDWFDYLYLKTDLAELSGKRYAGQRNHISRFKKLYPDYVYERITDENLPDVRSFYTQFHMHHLSGGDRSPTADAENEKIYEVFDNYALYGMTGGLLRAGGLPVAFSMGEAIGDTLFVHTEKADISYHGAYQMVVNEFVRSFAGEDIVYINREDDVGDEGLRTSKLSYHPCAMVEKYTVEVK